jgi:hypothetical protein
MALDLDTPLYCTVDFYIRSGDVIFTGWLLLLLLELVSAIGVFVNKARIS